MRAIVASAFAFGILVVACAKNWDDPNPSATAPSEQWPCGRTGQICAVYPDWHDDTCCADDELCPGPYAGDCMAGYCCDNAPLRPGAERSDGGAPSHRAMHPIRRAR